MARAERLAKKEDFPAAENVLEDAVSKVHEVRSRLADDFEDDAAFARLLSELREAIRLVRTKAEGTRRQIERVVAASDTLLTSLESARRRAA
jgi:predicted translin family RNA/ssDNA-binding protein